MRTLHPLHPLLTCPPPQPCRHDGALTIPALRRPVFDGQFVARGGPARRRGGGGGRARRAVRRLRHLCCLQLCRATGHQGADTSAGVTAPSPTTSLSPHSHPRPSSKAPEAASATGAGTLSRPHQRASPARRLVPIGERLLSDVPGECTAAAVDTAVAFAADATSGCAVWTGAGEEARAGAGGGGESPEGCKIGEASWKWGRESGGLFAGVRAFRRSCRLGASASFGARGSGEGERDCTGDSCHVAAPRAEEASGRTCSCFLSPRTTTALGVGGLGGGCASSLCNVVGMGLGG